MSKADLIEIRDEVWAAGFAARIDTRRKQVVISRPSVRFVPEEGVQPCVVETRVATLAAAYSAIRPAT